MSMLATTVFSVRNAGKVTNGDVGRLPVVGAQAINVMGEAATKNWGAVSDVAGKAVGAIDDAGAAVAKRLLNLEKAAKISSFAAKAVNPLLCGAAAIRAFRDEDTSSALIEEACAMGAMFGAETLIKSFRNPIETMVKASSGDLTQLAKDLAGTKKITDQLSAKLINGKTTGNIIKTCVEKISKMGKGPKTALFIGAELAFVVASVCLFDIGKKIGKKITGRDKTAETSQKVSAQESENFFAKKS